MLSNELEALKRLKIPVKRWGSSFRVKVMNKYGRVVNISSLSKASNHKLLAKQYKLSKSRVHSNFPKDYKRPGLG
ncbi:hypothetical protein GN244_ATG12626 [Phytophthora infestans]|uniref:Uncharacterized protein n=1 Tax=Phytophthora infestans TaxID=4787 RepID=A0A833VZF3_PHYIN|nr:hypothetical protein GN244_ATG12626 [Phytophthora infestans]